MFKMIISTYFSQKKGDETVSPKTNFYSIYFLIKGVVSLCISIWIFKRMARYFPELFLYISTGVQYLAMFLTVVFAVKTKTKKSWSCAAASLLSYSVAVLMTISKIILIAHSRVSMRTLGGYRPFLLFAILFLIGIFSGSAIVEIKKIRTLKAKS